MLHESCRPYYAALFADDFAGATAALKRAAAALKRSKLPANLQTIGNDRLRYLQYQLKRDAAPQEARELLGQLVREFSSPVDDELVAGMRISLAVQLRIIDERDGGAEYSPFELRADLMRLAPELRVNEVAYHLAIWGFCHGDDDLVTSALGQLTFKPGLPYADFVWQHVNLMHQLNKGTAISRDVEEMVRRIDHPRMWESVQATAWPECVRRNLVDGKVAGMLAEKLSRFGAVAPNRTAMTPAELIRRSKARRMGRPAPASPE